MAVLPKTDIITGDIGLVMSDSFCETVQDLFPKTLHKPKGHDLILVWSSPSFFVVFVTDA